MLQTLIFFIALDNTCVPIQKKIWFISNQVKGNRPKKMLSLLCNRKGFIMDYVNYWAMLAWLVATFGALDGRTPDAVMVSYLSLSWLCFEKGGAC